MKDPVDGFLPWLLLSFLVIFHTACGGSKAAGAELQTAQLNLEYATITAPISGRIGEPLTQVGGLVSRNSTSPRTTIAPLDPIWVRYKVSEGEYLQYREAGKTDLNKLKLTMLLADGTTYLFPGAAQNTVNSVDSKTGTLEIQATFPNPKHTLLPGQYGRNRFRSSARITRRRFARSAEARVRGHL